MRRFPRTACFLACMCLTASVSAEANDFVPLGAGAWETSGTYQNDDIEWLYPVGTTPEDSFFYYPEEAPDSDVKRLPDGTPADPTTVSDRGFRSVIVSDNGRVVTGQFDGAGGPARFVFGPNGEMVDRLANSIYRGGSSSFAIDLSADGLVMAFARSGNDVSRNTGFGRAVYGGSRVSGEYLNFIGYGSNDEPELPEALQSWASNGFMQGLNALSGDGQVLVGYNLGVVFRRDAADKIFRVIEGMGDAIDTSFDGSVIVGGTNRWTLSNGVERFGPETTDAFTYSAEAVSGDGSVIAGTALIEGQRQAFRWTESDGLVPLVSGEEASYVTDMSSDGSTIVGVLETDAGAEPFRWTAATGVQSLLHLLSSGGADLAGYELGEATGVSGDGTVIVGSGRNAQGATAAWLARITIVPEPASLAIATFACIAVLTRRRAA